VQAKGDTSITVSDATGLLPGQYINWNDGVGEVSVIGANFTPTTGSVSVPLAAALANAHLAAAAISVNGIDYIQIILPGGSVFPIPVTQLVLEPEQGTVQNYTPLMFQQLGYSTIFPKNVPLKAQYTAGYLYPFPAAIHQTCLELCISTIQRNASRRAGGVQSERVGDESTTWFGTTMPELTPEQIQGLSTYRFGRGIY
jgi:hypothetical protein